jgi:epoxyqueuosine reductase QueG
MERKELTRLVKVYAEEKLGFDLFGIASATDPEFDRAPTGHKPIEYLPGAQAVISVGLRVIPAVLRTTPSPIYHKHYITINESLNTGAYNLSRYLESLGYRCIYFPETDPFPFYQEQRAQGAPTFTPSFSHIAAATAAGLGRRGRVGVLLTPQFGPRQRFNSIITTAPLIPSPKFEKEVCLARLDNINDCEECIVACRTYQTGALKSWPEEDGVDVLKCASNVLDNLWTKGLSCGCCIAHCPIGA